MKIECELESVEHLNVVRVRFRIPPTMAEVVFPLKDLVDTPDVSTKWAAEKLAQDYYKQVKQALSEKLQEIVGAIR